jgi:hypothetical protein
LILKPSLFRGEIWGKKKNGSTVSNISGNFIEWFFYCIALIPVCNLIFI